MWASRRRQVVSLALVATALALFAVGSGAARDVAVVLLICGLVVAAVDAWRLVRSRDEAER